MYLFKNHRQTFSWPGERPSSYLKVIRMWIGANIKYLSEPFFLDFRCREGTSCYALKRAKLGNNNSQKHPSVSVLITKVLWKYAANLLENIHAKVWFQLNCKTNLLKWHFDMMHIFRKPFPKNTSGGLLPKSWKFPVTSFRCDIIAP